MEVCFEAENTKLIFNCGKCGEKNVQGLFFMKISFHGNCEKNKVSLGIECEKCNTYNSLN